ncbi:hypothetical protein E6C60_0159 [Paenibacillus algicola]|uniref:Uncharacterized protein n=1 Tax=Paenibacillus algicola TaxID=2565926 RepID=A0A4P8XEX4_9BACL|nr:hypothetical protein E6C60_0159 [Paenibacillus algicola]
MGFAVRLRCSEGRGFVLAGLEGPPAAALFLRFLRVFFGVQPSLAQLQCSLPKEWLPPTPLEPSYAPH